jgi:hypothetical protein
MNPASTVSILYWCRYGIERSRMVMSPSMNLVEEVKVTYRLNDRELCELEAGIERMELERQMSHDTLELLMEKVSLLCFSTFQKCRRKNQMSANPPYMFSFNAE